MFIRVITKKIQIFTKEQGFTANPNQNLPSRHFLSGRGSGQVFHQKDLPDGQWQQDPHMGQIPQDGENGQHVAFFYFLKLCCDQTVRFFQLLSTVLKRFCPLDAKNVSVLVLAIFFSFSNFHRCYPQLAIFGTV